MTKTDTPTIPAVTIRVYVLEIEHRHGTNVYVYTTDDACRAQLRDWVDEYWHEVEDLLGDKPETIDDEVVESYFGAYDDERYSIERDSLDLDGAEVVRA